MSRKQKNKRNGTTTIEFAMATPVVLFLILSTIIASIGVFRYQQVAALAREGSRWASVHGADYEAQTGNPAATSEDIFNKAILPMAMAMDRDFLSHEVTWDTSNHPLEVAEDVAAPFGNSVSVTVRYSWIPDMYVTGPIYISSTSTSQMAF